MSPDDVRQEIELKVVELIKAKLTDGTMTEERSRTLSKLVLDTLVPGMSWEALYKAIFTLDDLATELSPIVVPYAKEYETNVTQKATEMVKGYMRVGKFDAAVDLATKAIKNDLNVTWEGEGKTGPPKEQKQPGETTTAGTPVSSPGNVNANIV